MEKTNMRQLLGLAGVRPTRLSFAEACGTLVENYEIAYHVPGKGGWKRKSFKDKAAAEKFVDKLLDKEGDDIEVRWPANENLRESDDAKWPNHKSSIDKMPDTSILGFYLDTLTDKHFQQPGYSEYYRATIKKRAGLDIGTDPKIVKKAMASVRGGGLKKAVADALGKSEAAEEDDDTCPICEQDYDDCDCEVEESKRAVREDINVLMAAFKDVGAKTRGGDLFYELPDTKNGVALSDLKKRLEKAGCTDLKRGKLMGSTETALVGTGPDGGRIYATCRTKVAMGKPTTYVKIRNDKAG